MRLFSVTGGDRGSRGEASGRETAPGGGWRCRETGHGPRGPAAVSGVQGRASHALRPGTVRLVFPSQSVPPTTHSPQRVVGPARVAHPARRAFRAGSSISNLNGNLFESGVDWRLPADSVPSACRAWKVPRARSVPVHPPASRPGLSVPCFYPHPLGHFLGTPAATRRFIQCSPRDSHLQELIVRRPGWPNCDPLQSCKVSGRTHLAGCEAVNDRNLARWFERSHRGDEARDREAPAHPAGRGIRICQAVAGGPART